jgi:hypothetical protein
MRARQVKRMAAVGCLILVSLGMFAHPAHASWVSTHCADDSNAMDAVKRSTARTYADWADKEGYEWGGGCWNNNNVDDTPGQPDSGGEGPDCSGFVFKVWRLVNSQGAGGWRWYANLMNVHGPYNTTEYHAPSSGWPFYKLAKKGRTVTLYMDAFAKDGHIGLIETDDYPSSNTDYINEAKGDSYGTNVFEEDYRVDSDYVGVRRHDWAPDCDPNCAARGDSTVIVP